MGADALKLLTEAGALGLAIVELDGGAAPGPTGAGVVRIGVDHHGALPSSLESFDILLSADPAAPPPWVGLGERLDEEIAALADVVRRQPVAAAVAAQVHRMTLSLDFGQSLVLESLAYSMLLASEGFRAWRTATPPRVRPRDDRPRVALTREEDGALSIRLTRPDARNAVDAGMRDELAEALDFAAIDPDRAPVILSGEGPAFCAGGDLDEFGRADDVGRAHAVRVLQFATGRVAAIAPRVTARLHGACVGAGIEIPAAAGRVIARPDTVCRLPEVAMGLIPGAGGTASIPRRIGRHRAAYMAVSGAAIDASTALAWGLVDALDEGP